MEDAHPGPEEEGFRAEFFPPLEHFVKQWIIEHLSPGDVLVEDEGEDWETGEDGGVAQHEVPVVDLYGGEVEDEGEEVLDH